MKKYFLSITSVFMLVVSASAQNSSPYWSLAGNSNATSSSKLGTTNAINLRLYTNNAERLRVTTTGNVGIGTTSPSSKLTVNVGSGSPLRAQVAASTKFIVNGNGSVSIGSSTSGPSNGLYVSGNVGIGTSTPSYKLQVNGNASISNGLYVGNGGIFGYNSSGSGVYGSGSSYGVYGNSSSYGVYGNGGTYGVYGSGSSYGVYGVGYDGVYAASNNSNGYGAVTYGGYGGTYGSGTEYGLYGYSGAEYGVYGYTGGGGTGETGVYGYCNSYGYGVRGYSVNGTGIYGTGGTYAGYFTGNVYSTGSYLGSDRKLKKNIENLQSAMDLINKLQPKTYEFRQDGNYKLMKLPAGRHYGLIAQDLEQILPNLVKDTKFDPSMEQPGLKENPNSTVIKPAPPSEKIDFKAVNYTELIPIIIKAMQEQEAKIEALTQLVNKLQNTNPEASVKLSGISLGQNTPNPPQANSTRITYNIPVESSSAQLIFTNATGQKMKEIQLNSSGLVNIDTSTLPAGTYFYTLYVNGKSFDTKKMVVAR